MGFVKLFLLAYFSVMGLFTTFGVVWQKCRLRLTENAVVLLAFVSIVVGILYTLWMAR